MHMLPAQSPAPAAQEALSPLPLFDAVWRRRWIFIAAVGGSVIAGLIYAFCLTRIYQTTAELLIKETGSEVYADSTAATPQRDSFLYTQAGAILSTPVLNAALSEFSLPSMKTFAHVDCDAAQWLREAGGLRTDVGKKDDIVAVTMESPYPREATAIVNSVVNAYIARQVDQKRANGDSVIKVLQSAIEDLDKKSEEYRLDMLRFQAETGNVSFKDDRGNIQLDRLAMLSNSLTTAQLASYDLKAQFSAAKEVLASPAAIASFVEAQQTKGRDFGDKEFDDLRSQLQQLNLILTSSMSVQGQQNTRVRVIQAQVDLIKSKLAEKERSIAESHFQDITVQLAASEEKVKELRSALDSQQAIAMQQNPKAAEYNRLAGELERAQKQKDVLQARLEQVTLNNKAGAALSIEVLEPAVTPEHPIKPRKSFILAGALLFGLLLGAGLVLGAEWRDQRVRQPDEIISILDVPVVGLIPAMDRALSLADRGQTVDREPATDASEAFRSLRTTVSFGSARDARTILVTSPTPGDGKSTSASNLAIALAQGGYRTLLIDCDLRQPVQHRIFAADGRGGLTGVLQGDSKLRAAIRPTAVDQLYLLPCGSTPEKPAELLCGKKFASVISALLPSFDRIVIDSPPVVPFADARILAASADATLLVLRMNQSMRELSILAADGLRKVGANLVGVIANDVPVEEENGYYARWKRYGPGSRQRLAAMPPASSRHVSSRQVGTRRDELMAVVPAIREPDWISET